MVVLLLLFAVQSQARAGPGQAVTIGSDLTDADHKTEHFQWQKRKLQGKSLRSRWILQQKLVLQFYLLIAINFFVLFDYVNL